MKLEEFNHWWTEGKVRERFVPVYKRSLFISLEQDLKRKQVQILVGLRRVGKSTLFYQLIAELLQRGVPSTSIIYGSFDEPELQEKRIEELLKEYKLITGIDYQQEKIYLFVDEAQKSRHWVADVKLLYDHFPNIKILASGSASLHILSEAKKTLAGRALYYELKPLDFNEFLQLKKLHFDKRQSRLHQEVLQKEFAEFLWRPFPELIHEQDQNFIKNYIRTSVIEPVLLKDIPKEFKDVDILLLEKLVAIFFSNPGQYLSVEELAKELQRAKKTIYTALFYLEFSFLLRKVLNYRPSIRAASRKLSRAYAYHPVLTLPFGVQEEKFVENVVLFTLDARYYWRDQQKEIDFLMEDLTPVEVKWSSSIGKEETRWIAYFLKKHGKKLQLKKGFIVTKDYEGERENVTMIPLWKFCYLGIEK